MNGRSLTPHRFVLAASLLLAACGDDSPPRTDPGSILGDFAATWCTEPSSDTRPTVLLVRATTRRDDRAWGRTAHEWKKFVQRILPDLRPDTLDDFVRANETALDLRGVLTSTHALHFVTADEIREVIPEHHSHSEYDRGMQALIERYPGARLLRSVSVPGVSADGRQALVYATIEMRAVIRTGYFFLLAWEDGRWRIVAEATAWEPE